MVKYWVFLILAAALLAGCADYTSEPRFEGDVYTLAGLLIAGSSINLEHPVYITRSSTIQAFDVFNMYVTTATVTVKELESRLSWNLTPQFHDFKIKWVDEGGNIIQSGHSYRIEVEIEGYDELIWAETTVPQAATLVPDFYQYNLDHEGYSLNPGDSVSCSYATIDNRYPLALNTGNVSGALNLLAELYCREEFSTDLEFTVSVFGQNHPSPELESAYYSSGEGIRRIKFLGRFYSQSQPGQTDNYVLVKDYKQAFVFFGRYRVSLYVVDDNYYRYCFMPEGYLHGGVHSALGYFGSASGGVMYTEVVR